MYNKYEFFIKNKKFVMGKDQELLQAVKDQDLSLISKIVSKSRHSKKLIGSTKRLNVNFQDSDGMAALHQAALVGHVDIMHLLLESAASVEVQDNKGMRPLHYACWQGKEEPVRILLQCGSSPNLGSHNGDTPLHLASQHGHGEVTSLLLKFRGDPTLDNLEKKSPLDLACEFGRLKVVELLLTSDLCGRLLYEDRYDYQDNHKTSCLHLAAKNGHTEVIRILLQAGVNINRQTPQGTCLHEAALYGKIEVVRLLLECGIDVNKPNSYDQTALDIVNKFHTSKAGKELKQLLKDATYAVQAQAVTDYSNLDDHNFLSFREGDYITVLEQRADGIWRGYVNAEGQMAKTGYFPANTVNLVDKQTVLNRGLTNNHHAPTIITSPGPEYTNHHGNNYHHTNNHLDNGYLGGVVHNDVFPGPPSPLGMTKSSSRESDSRDSGISPQQHHPPYPFSGQVASPGRQSSPGFSDGPEWGVRHVDGEMSSFAPSRDSPLGSKRNSSSSSSSGGHLAAPNYVSIAVSNSQQQQHRLSGQSYESGVSLPSRQSYHSNSSSSLGSLDRLEESGYSSTVNVHDLYSAGLSDSEVLHAWLVDLHFDEYYNMFIQAGYDMPTISRMTPEDLTAVGITKPAHRKRLKSEISKLHIHDGIPDYKPNDLMEWLHVLNLAPYYETLLSQGYNINTVTEITWEDLEEIGIKKLGHQKKIILAIDKLKKVETNQKRMSTLERKKSSELLEAAPAPMTRWASSSSDGSNNAPTVVSVGPQDIVISTPRKSPTGDNAGPGEMKSFMPPEDEVADNVFLNQRKCSTGVVYQPEVIAIQASSQSPDTVQLNNIERNNLTYQSFHGPTTENGLDHTDGGTLKRPSAVVSPRPKPKPVAKIIAKTKRASREIPADIIKYDNVSGDIGGAANGNDQPEPIYDNPVDVMEQGGGGPPSGGRVGSAKPPVQNIYSSPSRTKKPPPPPKRTNSIKNDIRGMIEQARLENAKNGPESLQSRLNGGTSHKMDSHNGTIKRGQVLQSKEDFPPPPPSIANDVPTNAKPSVLDTPLNNVIEQLEQQSLTLERTKLRKSDEHHRSNPEEPPSNLLATSVSQNSCSTDTLPFANENVGTIKQKNNQSKPSIVSVNNDEDNDRSVDLNFGMFEDNTDTIRRVKPPTPQAAASGATGQRGAEAKKVPPPTPKRRDSIKGMPQGGANSGPAPAGATAAPKGAGESGDVLNEIGNMLQDLTDELDAMLDFD